jgi:gliding motility-associated-like protein
MQVYPSPNPEFSHDPYVTTIPETVIEFINLTEGIIVEQMWVFDTLNVLGISTEVNPTFEFPATQGGIYPVSLYVIDFNGCEATLVNNVAINDLLNVFVPTAFTPNSDGINDVLSIKGTDIDENRFKLKIFNRWGETVFESYNLNTSWDGSHMNGDYYVETGLYNYVIETYSLSTTNRIEIQGHVTVVR